MRLKLRINRIRLSLTGVSLIGLLMFSFTAISLKPASAQDSQTTPDLQQLNNKLEQLEKELEEVKSQMRAAAAQQNPSNVQTAPQDQGEARKPSAEAAPVVSIPSMAPVAPPPTGSVPMEGEITEKKDSVDFYGFVMLDSGYDFGQVDPAWFDVVRPTKLPSFPNQFAPSGNVYASVRQTRFGVKSSTPTKLGDLNTVFEFELFGTGVDAGQTTFRLRHAFGELGAFGAGQTWSPFMDIDVFPNSIEYWGPNGMVFFRNLQFRWTLIKTDRNTFMIAAERPGASADQGIYSGRIELSNITPQFILPDLSMQGHFDRKWGYFQIASMFRRIAWVDNNATSKLNFSGSAFGWGINTSSNLKFGQNTTGRL